MDPALAGALGGAGGLLGSAANIGVPIGLAFYGAKRAASEAKKSYRRQIALRRTAYQDTVYDLKQAGLNPILALRGANSLGSVQSGRVPDFAGAAVAGARQASTSKVQAAQGRLAGLQADHVSALTATERVKQMEGTARIREVDARIGESRSRAHYYDQMARHSGASTDQLLAALPRQQHVQDLYSGELGAALSEIQEGTKTLGSVGTALGALMQLRRMVPSQMPPRMRVLKQFLEDGARQGPHVLETIWKHLTGRSTEPTPKGPPGDPLNDFRRHGNPGIDESGHRYWLKRWDGQDDPPY